MTVKVEEAPWTEAKGSSGWDEVLQRKSLEGELQGFIRQVEEVYGILNSFNMFINF